MPSPSVTLGSVDVARKATACLACRKRKVRCHMVNERPPCTRCRSRDIECAFNKSLDTLLQDDVEWKKRVEKRLSAVERSLDVGSVSTNAHTALDTAQIRQELNMPAAQPRVSTSSEAGNISTNLNLSCSLSSFPAVSIHGTTQDDSPNAISGPAATHNNLTNPALRQDLLTGTKAEEHFSFYQKHLNPLIYYVLGDRESFPTVNRRSEFLAVAVCTVAACCTDAPDRDKWLESYKSFASARTFAKQHAFDDVRALCIGAFWLTHLATALNALAVRLSSELNLHRCLTKIPFTNIQCYERTRLYLLAYIVDHQCTLCYGRPPMTRELPSMEYIRAFLGSKFSNSDRGDSSLVSQVELWSTSAKVFDAFGADIERTGPSYVGSIDSFSHLYDNWLGDWQPILSPMSHLLRGSHIIIAQLPRTTDHILNLHYSAAKLQLFSHIFRGPAQRSSHPPITISNRNDLSKFASQAIHCAANQLDELTNMLSSGTPFGIFPAYLGTTIAFASVFLSRILITQSTTILSEHDKTRCVETIDRLCEASRSLTDKNMICNTTGPTSQNLHLKIVNALKSVKERCREENSRLNTRMIEDLHHNESQETHFGPHTSHELSSTIGLDTFDDMDMFLNFDFNVLDADSFLWDEGGGQGTQVS